MWHYVYNSPKKYPVALIHQFFRSKKISIKEQFVILSILLRSIFLISLGYKNNLIFHVFFDYIREFNRKKAKNKKQKTKMISYQILTGF